MFSGSETWQDQILCGDAYQLLQQMPADLCDSVITSPPYFRQRTYGHEQEIGGEEDAGRYVARLRNVFAEVLRVLKPSGTLWLVMGDKYVNGQQLGIPWRVAFALQDSGWILRNDVIWHKPNAMPCAAKRRLTVDHEYVFFFTRSNSYYYDADSIREPHVTFSDRSRMRGGRTHFFRRQSTPEVGKNGGKINLHNGRWDQAFHPLGRSKRSVWSVPLSRFRGAHFAVFPETLVTTCVLAGSPEHGYVLDPFLGSGTTAVVAQRLGRHFIGIDCVQQYCEMAQLRLRA
jgi:site-specific DNA-methyltransferase (adenine-specific)